MIDMVMVVIRRLQISTCYLPTSLKLFCIDQLFGHCIASWYAMSLSLVKLTEIGTSWGRS